MKPKGIPVVSKFFREREGKIEVVASRCKKCGMFFFPVKKICFKCMDETMEEVPLSGRGRLISFSISHDGLRGIKPPYAFGYVMLEEGFMLFSLLTKCEPYEEKLRIGMELEMVIEEMGEDYYGNTLYTYKFRPARGEEDKI